MVYKQIIKPIYELCVIKKKNNSYSLVNSVVEITVGSHIRGMSVEGWTMMQGGEVEGTERLWMVKSQPFPSQRGCLDLDSRTYNLFHCELSTHWLARHNKVETSTHGLTGLHVVKKTTFQSINVPKT